MDDHIEKLKEMVGKCRVGMLGVNEEGRMHFGPMSHVDIDDQGNIWFFISSESEKAKNIKKDNAVYLTYVHEAGSTFLTIEGIGHINTNKAKMRELFNPFINAWFPKGLDDRTLALLVVHPVEVEYWISESKVLTQNKMLTPDLPKRSIAQESHGNLRV